ncbi:hypothetical protein, conserved [Trypanosoma cruzi]|uniref:Uncharacterized protein n=1 Tax=Trypanosoma cruzi (strain CL Brener) TaxID=353153 RepID=Q4E5S7_TRYCC|nr:hypothetical protein, conserved [Trypanosoma cruzi]EAO00066.1 hypothetical protein, conserved [Trypanosoma cruzi]|eukprot:XP_821917.1 hypothetical protein [Trypanosoma cruzi strain CL Brener]
MSATPPDTAGNYFDMLVNSDPRVAFDVLHIGVFSTIEEEMGRQSLSSASSFGAMRRAKAVGEGKNARFVIPTHQPALDERIPQPQDVLAVSALLRSSSPSALREALGPAVLHVVQKYRPQVLREERQQRQRHEDKKQEQEEVVEEEEDDDDESHARDDTTLDVAEA